MSVVDIKLYWILFRLSRFRIQWGRAFREIDFCFLTPTVSEDIDEFTQMIQPYFLESLSFLVCRGSTGRK